jgi:NAD-dependent dihydropyrimidine dehydrogenase PreA subunit
MDKWLPVIEPDACTGCVACVDACNPGSLEMRDGLAVLVNGDSCASDEHCVVACPTDAIRMDWLASEGDAAVGQWRG